MGNEARDVRVKSRDVAQKPVAMARAKLGEFQSWLEVHGWRVSGSTCAKELWRASRDAVTESWLFVYDGPDKDTILLFDIAAREADRFNTEIAGAST